MRSIAIALVLSLAWTWGLGLGTCGSTVLAQEAGTWRKVAETIPLGSKVKIQLTDGKRIDGTLMRVDDSGVLVKRNTRVPESAITVTYDRMGNLERNHGGGGMSWGKAIGLGIGAGAGAILTILVIALQMD